MNIYKLKLENASDNSVRITELYFKNEDEVKIGDLVISYETSKADFDVEAENDGFIYFSCKKDDQIEVGEEIFKISKSKISEKKLKIQNSKIEISAKAKKLINKYDIDISKLKGDIILEKDIIPLIKFDNQNYNFKKNDLLIFGIGGHAKMCIDIINKNNNYNLVGYVADTANSSTSEYYNLKYFGTQNSFEDLKKRGLKNMILGIGLIGNLQLRQKLHEKIKKYFDIPIIIHESAIIESTSKIKQGTQVFAGAIVGSHSSIGENCIINSNSVISHDCIIGNHTHITPSATIAGNVIVGERVTIGMNASIYLNSKIADDTIIKNNESFN